MKVLRWITGHPIQSLIIITVIYGLLNLSNLGRWLGTEAPEAGHQAAATHGAGEPAAVEAVVPAATEVVVVKEHVEVIAVPADETPAVEAVPAEVPAPVAVEQQPAVEAMVPATEQPSDTAVAEETKPVAQEPPAATEETKPTGLLDKLFAGKPAEVMTETAKSAAATAGMVVEQATEGAEQAAEAVTDATDQAAEAVKEEKKGSLFDFFKRKESESGNQAAKGEPAQAAPAAAAQAPADVVPAAPPAPAVPEAAPAAAVAVAKVTIVTARQAFWNRDFAGAASMYETLISEDSDNPDLYGEYGNMLIQSGNVEKGLDAYEKAADLMIAQKRYREATPLIRFIGSYDPGRAAVLVEKMPRL